MSPDSARNPHLVIRCPVCGHEFGDQSPDGRELDLGSAIVRTRTRLYCPTCRTVWRSWHPTPKTRD